MRFCELFKSMQGEGVFAGVPSIFARVSGCNLKCCFSGGSICDTSYTSFNPEFNTITDEDVKQMMRDNRQISHLVITGGEPLIYRDELDKFVVDIYKEFPDTIITIETNGTIEPLPTHIDLYSISPKLSTSVPEKPCDIQVDEDTTYRYTQTIIDNLNKKRINIDRLCHFIDAADNIQLKFVYSNDKSVEEITQIVDAMKEKTGQWIDNYVMLMPEGQTNDQLQDKREKCALICVERGWTYTDRLQILIWGQKRNV